MNPFSCYLIGNETLTRECGDMLLTGGHRIAALVTRSPEVKAWGQARGLTVIEQEKGWEAQLPGAVDWLLSVANLSLVPQAALALAAHGPRRLARRQPAGQHGRAVGRGRAGGGFASSQRGHHGGQFGQ